MISSRLDSIPHIRLLLFLLCVKISLLYVVSKVGSSRSSLSETFIGDSGKTGLVYVGQEGKVIQLTALSSWVKAFTKKTYKKQVLSTTFYPLTTQHLCLCFFQ